MERRPNIIYLQNDHQAYYRHGWDGGVRPQTPHFDRLAARGARFTNAYCTTPLCAPTRRTIATGLFPHTHGQRHNYTNPPYTEVYFDRLREAGYRNCYIGKWHAGPGTPMQFGCEGFSCEGYGNPYVTKEYEDYLRRRRLPRAVHKVEMAFTMDQYEAANYFPKLKDGALYQCEADWCGEHAVGTTVTPKETHEAFFLANLACERLEELAKERDGRPFSLRVDFWGPHQPFFPTQEFLDLYEEGAIAEYGSFRSDRRGKPDMYNIEWTVPFGVDNRLPHPSPVPWETWRRILKHVYAQITMVDAAGGLILDKLAELGLDRNTLIVWTTDHGDSIASQGGHFDKGSHMSEEVMRIPFAIRWDGRIGPGQTRDELVGSVDFPVTLLDAAGTAFRAGGPGRSILRLLDGKEAWREDLMCESYGHGHGEEHLSRMLRHGDFKYVYHEEEEQVDELYNLAEDPYELVNRVGDPACRAALEDLKARLDRWMRETGDPARAAFRAQHKGGGPK